MKKINLLLLLLLFSAVYASAITQLSNEEVATITSTDFVCDYTGEIPSADADKLAKFYTSPATVTAAYVEGSTNQIKITNFAGKGYDVVINVDWTNGTISMAPQQVAYAGIPGLFNQITRYFVGICEDYAFEGIASPMDEVNTHTISGTVTEQDGTVTFKLSNAAFWQKSTSSANAIVYHYPYSITFVAEKQNPTGVDQPSVSKAIVSTHYYNMMGQHSATPFSGVNLMKVTYEDGTSATTKILNK